MNVPVKDSTLLSLSKKFGTFRDWKALKTGHFRSLCFWSGSILVLLAGGIMWFYVFLCRISDLNDISSPIGCACIDSDNSQYPDKSDICLECDSL